MAAIDSALNELPDQLKAQFILANNLQASWTHFVEAIDDTERLDLMQKQAFALAEGMFDWDANGRSVCKRFTVNGISRWALVTR